MTTDEKLRFLVEQRVRIFLLLLTFSSLRQCCSLHDEGLVLLKFKERVVRDPFGALSNWEDDASGLDPCSWFGVGCSEGRVISLNLEDLCLEGTLAPELIQLVHLQSLILRNNSFSGLIPEGFGMLKDLGVLDLGYNHLSGPLPSDLGSNMSLMILMDNNEFVGSLSSQIHGIRKLNQLQVDKEKKSDATKSPCERRLITGHFTQKVHAVRRSLLAPYYNPYRGLRGSGFFASSPTASASFGPVGPHVPSNERHSKKKPPSPSISSSSSVSPPPDLPPSVQSKSAPSPDSTNHSSKNHLSIMASAIGGGIFVVLLAVGVYFFRSNNVKAVNPWRTGLSGQLQKVFITGVSKLKRSELECACEDFSNIIGSSAIGTLYKGTLSSGVEIAVAAFAAKSSKDWSMNLELQFRKKIETLSKVNHKNFINLLGYCEEEQPFTRMMVFEYAPNGTLFEHLHIKESEHLDWTMRLRIAMGIAYCLEHMHQLNPPVAHKNLTSSSISLTEDYAAKVAEFSFWNEIAVNETAVNETNSSSETLGNTSKSEGLASNVYSFAVLLFEMMTGRLPYLVDDASIDDWASDYLRGGESITEMVDPSLESFNEGQLRSIGELIRSCIDPNPRQRPQMKEVAFRLREITGMTPDGAMPKLSPLWWAELEVLSAA